MENIYLGFPESHLLEVLFGIITKQNRVNDSHWKKLQEQLNIQ